MSLINFVDVHASQVIWRRIFLGVAIFFFITTCIYGVKYLLVPPPKTQGDYVLEYVSKRYNYTPLSASEAFNSKLQYRTISYEEMVKPELDRINADKICSFFIPTGMGMVSKDLYEVKGYMLTYKAISPAEYMLLQGDKATTETTILRIGVADGKFYETF